MAFFLASLWRSIAMGHLPFSQSPCSSVQSQVAKNRWNFHRFPSTDERGEREKSRSLSQDEDRVSSKEMNHRTPLGEINPNIMPNANATRCIEIWVRPDWRRKTACTGKSTVIWFSFVFIWKFKHCPTVIFITKTVLQPNNIALIKYYKIYSSALRFFQVLTEFASSKNLVNFLKQMIEFSLSKNLVNFYYIAFFFLFLSNLSSSSDVDDDNPAPLLTSQTRE